MHNVQDIFATIRINIIDFQQQQQQNLHERMHESDDDDDDVDGVPKLLPTLTRTIKATDQSQYVESCFEYYLIGLETSNRKYAIEICINVV